MIHQNCIRTYLLDKKAARRIRTGTKLTTIIPLHEAKISPKTLKSLDGEVEEFLMGRFGSTQIKLLCGETTAAEGEVVGASADGKYVRLNYKITEVYRR